MGTEKCGTDLTVKTDAVSESIMTFEQMISACPNPTKSELRKILAVQGYVLNNDGMKMREMAFEGKFSASKMQLAHKLFAASREALKAAAAMSDADGEVIDIPPSAD